MADLIVPMMAAATMPSSRRPPPCGKNIMPRVAALLDVMQISDITAVQVDRHVRAADLCRQRDPDGARSTTPRR
jgi:electron transfer flavoprotein alpha subunit